MRDGAMCKMRCVVTPGQLLMEGCVQILYSWIHSGLSSMQKFVTSAYDTIQNVCTQDRAKNPFPFQDFQARYKGYARYCAKLAHLPSTEPTPPVHEQKANEKHVHAIIQAETLFPKQTQIGCFRKK